MPATTFALSRKVDFLRPVFVRRRYRGVGGKRVTALSCTLPEITAFRRAARGTECIYACVCVCMRDAHVSLSFHFCGSAGLYVYVSFSRGGRGREWPVMGLFRGTRGV